MLKLIVGTKGSGKTKTMIDMIDKAVKTTSGNIVVIEKCMKLTTEINHSRSEEHTSELQSQQEISYAVFC